MKVCLLVALVVAFNLTALPWAIASNANANAANRTLAETRHIAASSSARSVAAASSVSATVSSFDVNPAAGGDPNFALIVLQNTGSTDATLTQDFIATLPAGLSIVAADSGVFCNSGHAATTLGSNALNLLAGTVIAADGYCNMLVFFTMPHEGTYVVALAAGALQTDVGDSTAASSLTLQVLGNPLMVSSSFTPASIRVGERSTLTLRFANSSSSPATFIGQGFFNYLPISGPTTASELEFATPQSASSDCSGLRAQLNLQHPFPYFAVIGTIPAQSTCSVSVDTMANVAGTYVNQIDPQSVITDIALNDNESDAILTVASPFGLAPAPINGWPLLMLLAFSVIGLGARILASDSMDLDRDCAGRS